MPHETPLLKVSRPVAACSRCRTAKIKCDGKLPACTSCEKTGRAAECTSTNDQFPRGKERSYVTTLEAKIEKLRAKLEEAKARKPSVVDPEDDMSPTRHQSHQVQPLSVGPTRRTETTAIDDLVSDFGFLSVNATARDFYGFTSTMSYARLILWACSKDPLPNGLTQPLPPRHAAHGLIQHYMNNIYLLLPVFDEATFYASFDNLYSDNAGPNDHWSVRLVLAISCASMSEERGDRLYLEAIGHICEAMRHAEHVLHPGAISSIQALVLLTEFAMLDPHHFDSWGLIGAASRAMVDLGLHQDPPKGATLHNATMHNAKASLEIRRRVYYCVYVLDRSTSLVQTRAFSFSDDSAHVKNPFQKSALSPPTSPQPTPNPTMWSQSYDHASDLISLRKLQSEWYTELFQSSRAPYVDPYSYIWKACDGMRKWFDALPSSTPPRLQTFFELELIYSYVYVLSPSSRIPAASQYAQKLVFEYCIRYADIILRLMSAPSEASHLTFYDAMRVFLTGRQFLEALQRNMGELLEVHLPMAPEVKHGAPQPLAVPFVKVPSDINILRFNILRSIACIKQITECLSRFGIRWGFLSWTQRYQSDASGILDELNSRLRNMDNERRPSMWHHTTSTGSLDSSHGGSMSYEQSQNQSTYSGHSVYQHSSPPGMPAQGYWQQSMTVQQTPGLTHTTAVPQTSPNQYHLQSTDQQQLQAQYSNFQHAPQQQHYQQQPADVKPPYQHTQQHYSQVQQPSFNFNEAPLATQAPPFASQQWEAHDTSSRSRPSHPTQQFASWSGYGGQGGAPDTLDEENAVPPNSNPWNIDAK